MTDAEKDAVKRSLKTLANLKKLLGCADCGKTSEFALRLIEEQEQVIEELKEKLRAFEGKKSGIETVRFLCKPDGEFERIEEETEYKYAVMSERFGCLAWWGLYKEQETAKKVAEKVDGKVVLWK